MDIAAIPGVTVPVTGGTRTTAIAETAQYTGTVSWSPAHNPFRAATAYTATISLAPKAGYTFSGVPANFFTVAGATAANSAGSGVVTAAFPHTAYATPAAGEGYSIDYANEPISITSGYEVGAGATFDTLLSDGDSIRDISGQACTCAKRRTGAYRQVQTRRSLLPRRPVTPEASFSPSAMTLSDVDASMEYSLDGGTTWTDAPGSSAIVSGVTPEGDIRVRVKATGTAPASLAQLIDILAQNAAPEGLTIDYVGETLNTSADMEFFNTSGNWAACTEDMALSALSWAGESQTVSLRTAGSGDAVASASVDVPIPARPAAPAGVTAGDESYSGAGDGSITGLDSTMEYDDGSGYTACVGDLTGLSPGEYLVRYRAVASSAFASEALPLTLVEGGASVRIMAEAGENGSISPYGAVRVAAGRDKTFTITPDDGYP